MEGNNIVTFISEGVDKAKAGEALAVYNTITQGRDAQNIPLKSHYGMGWIVYYAMHQTPDYEIAPRKRMLAFYLRLTLKKPHKQHSMILTEAIRLYKNAQDVAFGKRKEEVEKFSIVKFTELWDTTNLRPGDWKRKEVDGKPVSSTVEKLLTAIIDEYVETRQAAAPDIINILDQAIAMYPDAFNLYAQRADVCLLSGDSGQARDMLMKALLLAPSKFFLWSRLAALVDVNENPNLHIALLYKALTAPGPEQFKGKVRLALARALCARGVHAMALWEMEQIKRVYEANGWHLSPAYQTLLKEIPAGTAAADPSPAYRKVAHLAEEYIYSGVPFVTMKKSFHKLPDPNKRFPNSKPAIAWRVTGEGGVNVWFTPEHHRIDPNLPMGTSVRVKVYNGRVVKAEIEEQS